MQNGKKIVIDKVRPNDVRYHNDILTTLVDVTSKLDRDINHQINKYGYQRVDGVGWVAILVEEFGEATQAYLQKNYDEAEKEIMQTIACFTRFLVEVRRERDGIAAEEKTFYVKPV